MDFSVEQLDSIQLPLVNKFYKACNFSGKAGKGDVVFVVRSLAPGRSEERRKAQEEDEAQEGVSTQERPSREIVAAVRLQQKQADVYFLRSMCVAPGIRGKGIGGLLLAGLVEFLEGKLCYCYPFSHLERFYGSGGFQLLEPDTAPTYMCEAYGRYLAQGRDLILMARQG